MATPLSSSAVQQHAEEATAAGCKRKRQQEPYCNAGTTIDAAAPGAATTFGTAAIPSSGNPAAAAATTCNRNRQCRGWAGDAYNPIFQLSMSEAIAGGSSLFGGGGGSGNSTKIPISLPLAPCLLKGGVTKKCGDVSAATSTGADTATTAPENMLRVAMQIVDLTDHLPGRGTDRPGQFLSFRLCSRDCQPIDDGAAWQTTLCRRCSPLTPTVSAVKARARKVAERQRQQRDQLKTAQLEKKSVARNAKRREGRLRAKLSSLQQQTKEKGENGGGDQRITEGSGQTGLVHQESPSAATNSNFGGIDDDNFACSASPLPVRPSQLQPRPGNINYDTTAALGNGDRIGGQRPYPYPPPAPTLAAASNIYNSPVAAYPARRSIRGKDLSHHPLYRPSPPQQPVLDGTQAGSIAAAGSRGEAAVALSPSGATTTAETCSQYDHQQEKERNSNRHHEQEQQEQEFPMSPIL